MKKDLSEMSTREVIEYIVETRDFTIKDQLEKGLGHSYLHTYTQLNEAYKLLDKYKDNGAKHELVRDAIGSLGGNGMRDRASTIARYKTEVEHDETTTEQVIANYALWEKQKINDGKSLTKERAFLEQGF